MFDKPDSTGICFIGERPFQEFLSRLSARLNAGPIEDADGEVIGEHRGLALYTLGQRSGLGSAAAPARPRRPGTSPPRTSDRNALIVVQDQEHPLLMSDAFEVEEVHWLGAAPARGGEFECAVKTRYRQGDLACRVRAAGGRGQVRVLLRRPARAVTPGQYAVFYRGELLSRRRRHRASVATRAPRRARRPRADSHTILHFRWRGHDG